MNDSTTTVSSPTPTVTFSIGAYQDEATLESVVRGAIESLDRRGCSFEVLVIDDGSTDDTVRVAEALRDEDPRVRIHRHRENLGFGVMYREIYSEARGAFVLTAPGDGQFPAKTIVPLLDALEDADIVIGVRSNRRDPALRRYTSSFYNALVRLLFDVQFRDLNSVKAVRRDVAISLPVASKSAFADAEMVLRAHASGRHIVEREVEHVDRSHGSGSGGRLSVLLPAVRDLAWLRLRLGFIRSRSGYSKRLGYRAMSLVGRTVLSLFERMAIPSGEPTPDPREIPWIPVLEANWKVIRDELDAILDTSQPIPLFAELSEEQVGIDENSRWKTFVLYVWGREWERNCERCPRTVELLRGIPGMTSAMFSILPPQTRLSPHRGPFKGLLRYHLGLRIPPASEDCGIRIAGRVISWENGRSLVFDDTELHDAWNDTDEIRVVLFVDFERPLRQPFATLNHRLIELVGASPYSRRMFEGLEKFEMSVR